MLFQSTSDVFTHIEEDLSFVKLVNVLSRQVHRKKFLLTTQQHFYFLFVHFSSFR